MALALFTACLFAAFLVDLGQDGPGTVEAEDLGVRVKRLVPATGRRAVFFDKSTLDKRRKCDTMIQ